MGGENREPVACGRGQETAARWRCGPPIKNVTAHYNGPFCVSFHFCFDLEALMCF